jgi:outer membrane protein OmpA-like peptidoglycan-associated protein
MPSPSSLYLKNAAVSLVIIVPLVILVVATTWGTVDEQPPIISLSEAEGYHFRVGSAEISPEFMVALKEAIALKVRVIADRFRCDIVEVIGHTDGQRVTTRSNLDSILTGAAHGNAVALSPGSNADLGLMRAWAVISQLRKRPALAGLTFYGYSAGQVIDTTGEYASVDDFADLAGRRRIEIRVRRSPTVLKAQAADSRNP